MRDPNLDLFRSLAISAVVAYHWVEFFPYGLSLGWAGVDIFFVLSGFLIGTVFFRERVSEVQSIFRFWAARWFRTLPPYYAILMAGLAVSSWIGRPWPREMFVLRPKWMYFVFLQNTVFGLPFAFSPSWSLCVEEQFYVALPLLFSIVHRTRTRVGILIGIILLANGWRFSHAVNPNTLVFRGDALALGVLLALLKTHAMVTYHRVQTKVRKLALPLGFVVAAMFAWPGPTDLFLLLFNCVFATLLFTAEGGVALPGARTAINLWIARISYSIYLTHRFALLIADKVYGRIGYQNVALKMPLLLVAVAMAGMGAYFLLEKPSYGARRHFMGKGEAFTTSRHGD